MKNKKEITSPFEGKMAPKFCLPDQLENKVCLRDIISQGKKTVLFFYPKDMTSGCTVEAIDFSENKRKFSARGVKLYGISKLTPKSKTKFIEKNNLKIDLLSDEDFKICDKYGVWREKNMYGKKVMGIARETFVIDEKGKVIKHFQKVKPQGHVDEVIEFLKSLKK